MGGEDRHTVAGTAGLVDGFAIHFGGHGDDGLMELKLEIGNNYKCGFDVIGSSRRTKCHSPSPTGTPDDGKVADIVCSTTTQGL